MNIRYYKGLIMSAASERVDHSIRGVQPDVCDLGTWKIRWSGPQLGSYETHKQLYVVSIGV